MRMTGRHVVLAGATLILAAGCAKQQKEESASSAGAGTTRPREGARAEPGAPETRPAGPARPVQPPDEHAGRRPPSGGRAYEATLPPSGHLGAAFTVNKAVPLTKVMADLKAFEGKKIRTAGKVVAQCIHRRAWFAIGHEGKRPYLRAITAPRFFIHATAQGMNAEVEGTLQFREVSERMAKHLAKSHGLFGGNPDAVKGPQKAPVLMATGAKFTK